MRTVELRCPVGPRRLLSKLLIAGERPHIVGNLVELACSDCKQAERKKGNPVVRVLHRYDLSGALIESELVM